MSSRFANRLAKYILISFFLLAQASVLAHELDFDAHQLGDACEVCLLNSALGNAPISAESDFAISVSFIQYATCLPTTTSDNNHSPGQPRAPPCFTSA